MDNEDYLDGEVPQPQRVSDIDAGTIIEGKEAIDDVGKHICDKILAVASGGTTKTGSLGHRGPIAIYWAWPVSKQKCDK